MPFEARDSASSSRGGLFESLRSLSARFLAIVQTRLELLATELQEEGLRIFSILVWAMAGLFFMGMAAVFGTLLVVFALWKTHPLLALGIPAFFFIAAALIAFLIVLVKARSRPRLFAASLAELSKDRASFSDSPPPGS